MWKPLLTGVLALAVAAPAMADDGARPASCAFVRHINDFKEVDDFTAIVRTGVNKRFKVTFVNRCRELKWALFARVEARPGICLSRGDVIVVGRPGFSDRCMIASVEALPPKNQATPASY